MLFCKNLLCVVGTKKDPYRMTLLGYTHTILSFCKNLPDDKVYSHNIDLKTFDTMKKFIRNLTFSLLGKGGLILLDR